jgi:hypothetical protein
MKTLGSRNALLLSEGAKTCGTFVEGFYYVEESVYVNEHETLHKFCHWIDEEIGGGSERNLEILFQAFINPKNNEAMDFAMNLKSKIAEIKERMKR